MQEPTTSIQDSKVIRESIQRLEGHHRKWAYKGGALTLIIESIQRLKGHHRKCAYKGQAPEKERNCLKLNLA